MITPRPSPTSGLRPTGRPARWALAVALLGGLAGCRSEMYDQPKYEPLEAVEPTSFFKNGQSSRPLVAGTVARGQLRIDDHLYTGKVDGKDVETFPFPIDDQVMRRGQQRYNIFCSPCHGRTGDGQGMIVQRGFTAPPSFHIERLRKEPVGHYFDVITHGHGVMYSYASRVAPEDRWAITAYIRALQLSQHASPDDLSAEDRDELARAKPGEPR